MSLREFYKCQYELEITRKTDLTAALSIPLGVVSLLIGALVLMAKDLHTPLSKWEWSTLAFICLAAFACMVVGFHLFKAHTTYTYAFLPRPDQIQEHYEGLLKFHVGTGKVGAYAEDAAEHDTLEYIDDAHAAATTQNSRLNDEKSGQQFRANQALMIAVVLASVAGVLYVINSISSPTPSQRVEVVNLKDAASNGLISTPAAAASATPAASAAASSGRQPGAPASKPAAVASEVKPPRAGALAPKP